MAELESDKEIVWLMQFVPFNPEDLFNTHGARTDCFKVKNKAIEFVKDNVTYQNADVEALIQDDLCNAEYMSQKGILFLFQTILRQ